MHFCPRALVTYEDAVFFQQVWHGQMLVAQQCREKVRGLGRYDHFPVVLFRHFKEAEKTKIKPRLRSIRSLCGYCSLFSLFSLYKGLNTTLSYLLTVSVSPKADE